MPKAGAFSQSESAIALCLRYTQKYVLCASLAELSQIFHKRTTICPFPPIFPEFANWANHVPAKFRQREISGPAIRQPGCKKTTGSKCTTTHVRTRDGFGRFGSVTRREIQGQKKGRYRTKYICTSKESGRGARRHVFERSFHDSICSYWHVGFGSTTQSPGLLHSTVDLVTDVARRRRLQRSTR